MPRKEKDDLKANFRRLEEISTWFEEQTEIDLEKGLEKVREGATLIKATRLQLKNIKNEFEEIQKSLED